MPQKGARNIDASFTNYLRKSSKLRCPFAGCSHDLPDIDGHIRSHIQDHHQDLLHTRDIGALVSDVRKGTGGAAAGPSKLATPHEPPERSPQTLGDPGGPEVPPDKNDGSEGDDDLSPYKRRKSPDASSVKARPRSASPPKRSRARAVSTTANDPEFSRSPQVGKLWSPDEHSNTSPLTRAASRQPRNLRSSRSSQVDTPEDEAETQRLIKQPDTRQISQGQLVAEVKGIYAGLVMVESKCIEVDNAQSSQSDARLNNEQWQALIALHRTLLHEHHDFFLASQHPSASQILRKLASKYAMPARMWRHGIHSFLELLRHRLPASLEHMLTFIYLAYSMMALLYETVPAFEDTWIECLGDLGRYRMAIEDDDIRDREIWTSVSRLWYSKASDKAPDTGRLYHHLAILARPNALQQLFYYTKSLCVPIPFASARESIMTLFDPILNATGKQNSRLIPIDVAFVKAHGLLFSDKCLDDFPAVMAEFLGGLDHQIGRTTRRWMESGYYIGITNCCAMLSYGKKDNPIMKGIRSQRAEEPDQHGTSTSDATDMKISIAAESAIQLAERTYDIVLHRIGDPNVLPFFHVVVVFMYHMSTFPDVMGIVEKSFPWKLVSLFLNSLLLTYREHARIQDDQFPRQDKELAPRPLPEDFAMKGLVWVDKYFPTDWFSNDKIDDDEKYFEVASMTDERKERILWVASRIAKQGKWLTYDQETHQFGVDMVYDKEIEGIAKMNITEAGDDSTSRSPTFASATTAARTDTWRSEKDDEEMLDFDDPSTTKPIIRQ
ncbi:hypothetical protein F4778DRAFT_746600 [Xylariomycetidae sp. FL2044]|nr:hypothetical protein F4778DRAFT_746600 [Xylariomycetidae sp. FL2044]